MAERGQLRELAALFLKLGTIGFGGPAAHIAMTHDEVVVRRRWFTDAQYADMIGMANLVPGPNSTEVAIHVGRERAGWRGLVIAGVCFILPATLIMGVLAWAYERYGTKPQVEWLLYGVKPVVIALIAQAIWLLGRATLRGVLLPVVGVAALVAAFVGVPELLILATAGVFVAVWRAGGRLVGRTGALMPLPLLPFLGGTSAATTTSVGLAPLFFAFLWIGAVLYGSGYVLFALLQGELVDERAWLTEQQLLDAVAVGQVTPGPLFTTATFIGYLLAGVPGAVVATVAIFLPGFIFVAVTGPLIPRLRGSKVFGAFLDGVVVASLALIGWIAWVFGRDAIIDGWTTVIALVAALLLFRWRVSSIWLVLGGALAGLLIEGLL
jgi:chromate transporter